MLKEVIVSPFMTILLIHAHTYKERDHTVIYCIFAVLYKQLKISYSLDWIMCTYTFLTV